MKNENETGSTEKKLESFFQQERECVKASADLWSKLAPKLAAPEKARVGRGAAWTGRWFSGPRLVGVAVSLTIVLVLLGVGAVWLATGQGKDSPSVANLPAFDSGRGPEFVRTTITATATATHPPAITMTPAPAPLRPGLVPPAPTTIIVTQPPATTARFRHRLRPPWPRPGRRGRAAGQLLPPAERWTLRRGRS